VKGIGEPNLPDEAGRFGSFFSMKDGYNLQQIRRGLWIQKQSLPALTAG
jgi:hypothetical protein